MVFRVLWSNPQEPGIHRWLQKRSKLVSNVLELHSLYMVPVTVFPICHYGIKSLLLFPLTQRSWWGVYWFHSICPSVRPSRIACLLCGANISGLFHFIFIHLIKRRQKVCRIQSFLQNFKILAFFFSNLLLCLVLTWDLMSITRMGNHGATGGISECRHSTCSSCNNSICLNPWLFGIPFVCQLNEIQWYVTQVWTVPCVAVNESHSRKDTKAFNKLIPGNVAYYQPLSLALVKMNYLDAKPIMTGHGFGIFVVKWNFNILFQRINSKMVPMISTLICMESLIVKCGLYESIHCYC